MRAADVIRLLEENEDNLPEDCFLTGMKKAAARAISDAIVAPGDTLIAITSLAWRGTWSGNSWPFFLAEVAPLIRGDVEAIVVWEGGDCVRGLLIHDGQVAECDVVQRVVRPEGWPV